MGPRITGHTCWPRQIRGPALKGRKMNGFPTKYLLRRSSRNRSGSKYRARWTVNLASFAKVPAVTYRQGPNSPCGGASGRRSKKRYFGSGREQPLKLISPHPTPAGTKTGGLVGSGFGIVVSRAAILKCHERTIVSRTLKKLTAC